MASQRREKQCQQISLLCTILFSGNQRYKFLEVSQKVAPNSKVMVVKSGKKAGMVTTALRSRGLRLLRLEEAFKGPSSYFLLDYTDQILCVSLKLQREKGQIKLLEAEIGGLIPTYDCLQIRLWINNSKDNKEGYSNTSGSRGTEDLLAKDVNAL
ncbi:hypothetical protein L1887_29174 [Cichorium endivia]|nr:hypothetical protein L1887_29174 [Cichorium endivia]